VQIIERILDLTGKPFDLLCCLVVRHLGSLYQRDESLAAGISMLLYPSVRPWNVKRALFGDSCDSFLSYPSSPINSVTHRQNSIRHEKDSRDEAHLNQEIESDAFDVWQKAARYFYHTYLTLFMSIFVNRQKNSGSKKQRGISHTEIVTEWLHLSLYMSQENNDYGNNDDNSDKKVTNNDTRYSHGSSLRIEYNKSNRNHISNDKKNKDNDYLYYVKTIIAHPDLYAWDPLRTATLCDAYGCHKEVTIICRQYLTQCSFRYDSKILLEPYDSKYNLSVKSLLVRGLKVGLSHLLEGLLMNFTSDSISIERISDDAMTSMRDSVTEAIQLLWVILAKDVVWKVSRGGHEEALIDTNVKELVTIILSSDIYLWSLPSGTNQDEDDIAVVDLLKEILRMKNDPTNDSMLPLQLIFSHTFNNSGPAEIQETFDSKYFNLLEGIRIAVVSEITQCILSALDSTLTSRLITVFPETVSNYLDIDFICQLI
jgi:hypothetical protein